MTAPPDGDGALVFELALSGAIADVEDNEALLVREVGNPLRFAKLAAWDERGKALPARMEETEDGLRLVVDDTGAIGTITVDPLLTTAAWTAESDQRDAYFGWSVASAGDVNGDGYGDVVVGAPYYDNGSNDEGRAYVYLGSSSGLATSAAWTAESNQASAYFGYAVASAGDVNGDGYGDVVVGATDYDNGETNEGRAYVYLGSSSGLATSAAWTAESNLASASFGYAVASAGDVNGDGYGDVMVGAWAWANGEGDEGGAWVYLGSSSGLATSAAWTAEGNEGGARYGASLASAGDVNGDGYGDVVVGTPYYDGAVGDDGRASVYLGSSSGLATSAAWTAEAAQGNAYFGMSVASAGDVNGDGYGDVVVGASHLDDGEFDGDCDGVDTCYVDDDGDGYRTTSTFDGTTVACDGAGEATVDAGADCDDADATVNPAAAETIGDEVDADCDGAESCYTDADADGYRTEDGAVVLSADTDCTDPTEAIATAGFDCDDTQASVSPAATEIAGDGIDGDCDDAELCYVDADGDGYRLTDTVLGSLTCDGAGEALATVDADCDDADASVNPDGIELPGDAIDSDCDGSELCYADADADGYVDGLGVTIDSVDTDCDDTNEALVTALDGDCDDTDAAYNPGAAETDCTDPADYNCDGSAGYSDADADGWAACEECDDLDATVYPDATEVAGDLVDQDCDGVESCYVDADDDGYRPDATSVVSGGIACDGAGEAVATDPTTDCDDADAGAYPGATETVGDEVDQSCDGDEECYVDADGDGYTGTGGATVASADLLCDGPGEATDLDASGDCDDSDAAYNPGALEDDCSDPADYNCDGSSGVVDGDGDGFYACEECDDALGTINPDADEVCDGADNDCDGTIDVDAIDAETWYADADGDGYTTNETVTGCDQPDGYAAATEDDCDDDDATSNPAGDDVPDDGIDQDCDGLDATSGDTEDTGDVPDEKDGGTCGCASTGSAGAVWSLVLGLVALTVRRRRAA